MLPYTFFFRNYIEVDWSITQASLQGFEKECGTKKSKYDHGNYE